MPIRTWKMIPGLATFAAALTLMVAPQCATAADGAANVNAKRMLDPAATAANWMSVGGTYSEQHYSPLTQINKDNVAQLGLAWFADYDTNLTQAGTPLEIDGVIYVSTAWSHVYAFDARTGKTLWEYDPKTPGRLDPQCLLRHRQSRYRGLEWQDLHGHAGWPAGGDQCQDRQGSLVGPDHRSDQALLHHWRAAHRQGQGAHRRVRRRVRGARLPERLRRRDRQAGLALLHDSGRPDEGLREPGHGNGRQDLGRASGGSCGGGGTVWDAIVYDPVTNLVYFGTGNGTPWNDHYRDPTDSDNLFLASIVALNADTGEYVWHYQETPADTWDYDAVSPMSVVDMKIDGKERHVLLQPSKNGFFYVLEARTGKLLHAPAVRGRELGRWRGS